MMHVISCIIVYELPTVTHKIDTLVGNQNINARACKFQHINARACKFGTYQVRVNDHVNFVLEKCCVLNSIWYIVANCSCVVELNFWLNDCAVIAMWCRHVLRLDFQFRVHDCHIWMLKYIFLVIFNVMILEEILSKLLLGNKILVYAVRYTENDWKTRHNGCFFMTM